ncbi:hypothetical protein [Paenibacillus taichungensis]|jgi:hypothetical protein
MNAERYKKSGNCLNSGAIIKQKNRYEIGEEALNYYLFVVETNGAA